MLERLKQGQECYYKNIKRIPIDEWYENLPISKEQIQDASDRLERFAPLISRYFAETQKDNGIIESPLVAIPNMRQALEKYENKKLPDSLYLKLDSNLAVAGSIKARGGIYEILKHAEDLLIEEKGFDIACDYSVLDSDVYREFFKKYTIQVGSTGNLGLSIGIISAKLGFRVIVHMSKDAKEWKKALLRSNGVDVIEYEDDYSKAVEEGRKASDQDPNSYFVDDENSINLFLGYAVAAFRLKKQLEAMGIVVDSSNPLVIYIPCGVGGAPGGVTYGCKYVFGENVYCYFVEPTNACCMLLGMMTGKHDEISVKDIGLSGITKADGLAVGRPSKLVGKLMEPILDGLYTVLDERLDNYLRMLYDSEGIFVEPSACAGFKGFCSQEDIHDNGVHIVWATGGSLVPPKERKKYLEAGDDYATIVFEG